MILHISNGHSERHIRHLCTDGVAFICCSKQWRCTFSFVSRPLHATLKRSLVEHAKKKKSLLKSFSFQWPCDDLLDRLQQTSVTQGSGTSGYWKWLNFIYFLFFFFAGHIANVVHNLPSWRSCERSANFREWTLALAPIPNSLGLGQKAPLQKRQPMKYTRFQNPGTLKHFTAPLPSHRKHNLLAQCDIKKKKSHFVGEIFQQ